MSYSKDKCDPKLGREVEEYLQKLGVNTPMTDVSFNSLGIKTPFNLNDTPVDNTTKVEKISHHFGEIMKVMGLDLEDDSLSETPRRVAKMFVNELFWGLNPDNFPKCTAVENKIKYDEMVVERKIKIMSVCEHHFLPIEGYAYVGYLAKGEIVGLSKLNRVVEYFARRPQIQERLAEQIYHALSFILKTEDIAVILTGEHFCVKMRGVEDPDSDTVTSKLGGAFRNPVTKNEFLQHLALKD